MLHPMLTHLGPVPTHALFVGLGVVAAVIVFVTEARRRGHRDERLLIVVTGALVGVGVFGGEPVQQAAGGALSADATLIAPAASAFAMAWGIGWISVGRLSGDPASTSTGVVAALVAMTILVVFGTVFFRRAGSRRVGSG